MIKEWTILHECDDEYGYPTCWALEINDPDYGRFVWIDLLEDGTYDVVIDGIILANCRTFLSAKRLVDVKFDLYSR